MSDKEAVIAKVLIEEIKIPDPNVAAECSKLLVNGGFTTLESLNVSVEVLSLVKGLYPAVIGAIVKYFQKNGEARILLLRSFVHLPSVLSSLFSNVSA